MKLFPFTLPAFLLAFFLWFPGLLLVACGTGGAGALRLQGETMGTTWSVIVVPGDNHPLQAAPVRSGIEQVLRVVNDRMSTWQPDSELSRFNRNRTTNWFPVSSELVDVVEAARGISEISAGIYDVTVGPLVNLWGFGAGQAGTQPVPAEAEIEAARARVGFQHLETREQPPALRKQQPDMYVDLSSIAKGYGVDQVGEYLEAQGSGRYMVEIGGEVRTLGLSPRGDAWRIAIEKPVDLGRAVQQGLKLERGGLATSGDYRNFFTENSRRYSHTIDPVSGRPVIHRLASVSVLAQNTMLADGYATLLMAMGEVKGREFALEHGIDAFFIWRTEHGFDSFATDGFRQLLVAPD
ncbi:MAG: FAD:protein FMN transferase [Thiothrix sp.]|nr:FAD:protein FMN transferase [Thiothrix sp.]